MLDAESGGARFDIILIYSEAGFCQWLRGVYSMQHAAVGMATDAKLTVVNWVGAILAG